LFRIAVITMVHSAVLSPLASSRTPADLCYRDPSALFSDLEVPPCCVCELNSRQQLTQKMMKHQPIIQIFFQTFNHYVFLFQRCVNPVDQYLRRETKQLAVTLLLPRQHSALHCASPLSLVPISHLSLLSTSTSFMLFGCFLKGSKVSASSP